MPYNPIRIDPLDRQPRKAIGVMIPFSGASVFNSTYTTKDAIRSNLINYFLTGKNERVLNPGFGAGLRDFIFEQITTDKLQELEVTVTEQIGIYFPRILVTDLRFIPDIDRNVVTLKFNYQVEQTNIEDEVIINFEL